MISRCWIFKFGFNFFFQTFQLISRNSRHTLLKKICFISCMLCVCVFIWVQYSWRSQKASDLLELELEVVVSCSTWVLETKFRSFRRAALSKLPDPFTCPTPVLLSHLLGWISLGLCSGRGLLTWEVTGSLLALLPVWAVPQRQLQFRPLLSLSVCSYFCHGERITRPWEGSHEEVTVRESSWGSGWSRNSQDETRWQDNREHGWEIVQTSVDGLE